MRMFIVILCWFVIGELELFADLGPLLIISLLIWSLFAFIQDIKEINRSDD